MYTSRDFRTKAELRRAIAAGDKITIFQPGPFGGNEPRNGTVSLEGPHYPKPHRWYASAEIRDGLIVKVS